MEIRDYESGRPLNDISIVLSADEAAELHGYLSRLLSNPELRHVHLSEISGLFVDKEIAFSLDGGQQPS